MTRALGGTLMWILCDWAEMTLSLDWSQSPGSGGIQVKPAHQPSGSANFYTQGSVFLRSKQTVVVSLVAAYRRGGGCAAGRVRLLWG